eukprot:4091527-Amphidinium_carterae.1
MFQYSSASRQSKVLKRFHIFLRIIGRPRRGKYLHKPSPDGRFPSLHNMPCKHCHYDAGALQSAPQKCTATVRGTACFSCDLLPALSTCWQYYMATSPLVWVQKLQNQPETAVGIIFLKNLFDTIVSNSFSAQSLYWKMLAVDMKQLESMTSQFAQLFNGFRGSSVTRPPNRARHPKPIEQLNHSA